MAGSLAGYEANCNRIFTPETKTVKTLAGGWLAEYHNQIQSVQQQQFDRAASSGFPFLAGTITNWYCEIQINPPIASNGNIRDFYVTTGRIWSGLGAGGSFQYGRINAGTDVLGAVIQAPSSIVGGNSGLFARVNSTLGANVAGITGGFSPFSIEDIQSGKVFAGIHISALQVSGNTFNVSNTFAN